MNLIDFVVIVVMEEPERHEGIGGREYWTVKCLTVDMSDIPQEETLVFSTYEEARAVDVGYKGLH